MQSSPGETTPRTHPSAPPGETTPRGAIEAHGLVKTYAAPGKTRVRALDGLTHTFVGMRLGVHDTPRHLARLDEAVDAYAGHRLVETRGRLRRARLHGRPCKRR